MNQNAVTMNIGNGGHGVNRSAVQRWSAVLGGSALAIYGLTRRSPLGVAMAATGGAVAYFGAKPATLTSRSGARSSVILNCSPEQAYRFWHDFENLPRFMRHLDNVSTLDNRRTRWTAIGPFGQEITWDAEIDEDRPNEFISWHSVPGSDIEVSGAVSFRAAPANRGTLVRVEMNLRPPAGRLGMNAAKLLGKHPEFLVKQDLRRMKALVETGEIPTTDGQSHGPRSITTGFARMADPDRPVRRNSPVSEQFQAMRRIS